MQRVENSLPRPWDQFDVYLFDIDGTLINCTDAVHYFAFCEALKTLSGRDMNLDGVVAHGNTDVGILRDALAHNGLAGGDWRTKLPEIREAMGAFVEERKNELCPTVLPRVEETLQHLRRRGAKLGVATGNLERIGKAKLQRAGLMQYFDFAGWSDDYEYRADVFRNAVAMAHTLYGPGASVCALGDTPLDVQAAHAAGIPVVAVATGIYSVDSLIKENPSLCLPSFDSLWIDATGEFT